MTSFQDVHRTRAKALSGDDRRAMIVDAVIPLLIEHGSAVTTRQIAEAAGIAEGTIFRVFADKDALFAAAVEKFLDPTESDRALRAIDAGLPLQGKINEIIILLRGRMTGIFGIMQAVGMSDPPPRAPRPEDFTAVVEDVLRPDLDRLGVSVDRAASFLRLLAFATAIPHFNRERVIPTDELARLITYGIAAHPAEGENNSHAL